jgi:hypothetical protein
MDERDGNDGRRAGHDDLGQETGLACWFAAAATRRRRHQVVVVRRLLRLRLQLRLQMPLVGLKHGNAHGCC